MNPGTRIIDGGERYVLLRRLEERIKHGEPATTEELALHIGVTRRTVCRYLTILQTAAEFRLILTQVGWRWEVLR
jgi:response regulator of citrate/malate metabolism